MQTEINLFKNEINNIVKNIFPEVEEFEIDIDNQDRIAEYITKLEGLEDVYMERGKYRLEWAYENAQNVFDEIHKDMQEFITNKANNETKILLKKVKQYLNKDKKIKKDLKFNFGLFSYAKAMVSTVELILSVILIILISNMSHETEVMIKEHSVAIMVVIGFALFKIFLEKHGLMPKMEKYGWDLYRKTLEEIRSNIIVGIIMVEYFEVVTNDEEKVERLLKYIEE